MFDALRIASTRCRCSGGTITCTSTPTSVGSRQKSTYIQNTNQRKERLYSRNKHLENKYLGLYNYTSKGRGTNLFWEHQRLRGKNVDKISYLLQIRNTRYDIRDKHTQTRSANGTTSKWCNDYGSIERQYFLTSCVSFTASCWRLTTTDHTLICDVIALSENPEPLLFTKTYARSWCIRF